MRNLTLLGLLVLTVSCRYDIDKLYRYDNSDASVSARDGSVGTDAGSVPAGPLIELYRSAAFVDDDCKACANRKCAKAEEACRADPSCLALTECAAQGVNPDQLSACRSEHADWCADDVVGRGLAGPFYTCVFRDKCAAECNTQSDWSCIDEPSYSWETTPETSVTARIRFYEALQGTPAAGLTVKVYRRFDDDLDQPAATHVTDADGLVTLTLPTPLRSFLGYLEIAGDGWYPTLIQLGYPIARESVIAMPIVTRQSVNGSVLASGVQQQASRGQLQIRMFGCAGVLMRDVSFESDLEDDGVSATWYFDGQTADTMITKTTTYGNGGIINVREGTTTVTGKLGDRIVARTSAPVRAGFLTIVLLAPLSK